MTYRPSIQVVRREASAAALQALSRLSPLQQRVFANRGIADPSDLDLSLKHLLPPEKFPASVQAARVLADALQESRKILLIGDYDADGATGIVTMKRGLSAMGHQAVEYIVPDRFRHGYGFCMELLREIPRTSADILMTIDNGMSSQETIRAARKQGFRVLVLDHHLPGRDLPDADVIVNPNSPPVVEDLSSLAGVGVTFYVLLALRQELRERGWFEQKGIEAPNLAQFLDLVALGTVADVVPLDRNNRILVEQGLRRIRSGAAVPGIISLLRSAKRDPRWATSTDLAMVVAPRINAAGRMEKINYSIECLLEDRRVQAHEMAVRLSHINRDRRATQREMEEDANKAFAKLPHEAFSEAQVLCLYEESWHEGVVGILASRVRERFGLPAIVFASGENGEWKGSGRSVSGLHLRDALVRVAQREPELMSRFGGHAMAVGLSLAPASSMRDAFERFRDCLASVVQDMTGGLDPRIRIDTDGPLSLQEMTFENARFASLGHPWGKDFPEPRFEGEFDILKRESVKDQHSRLQLRSVDAPEHQCKAMAFFHEKFDLDAIGKSRCRIVFGLDADEFQGRRSCTLIVHHIEPV